MVYEIKEGQFEMCWWHLKDEEPLIQVASIKMSYFHSHMHESAGSLLFFSMSVMVHIWRSKWKHALFFCCFNYSIGSASSLKWAKLQTFANQSIPRPRSPCIIKNGRKWAHSGCTGGLIENKVLIIAVKSSSASLFSVLPPLPFHVLFTTTFFTCVIADIFLISSINLSVLFSMLLSQMRIRPGVGWLWSFIGPSP